MKDKQIQKLMNKYLKKYEKDTKEEIYKYFKEKGMDLKAKLK